MQKSINIHADDFGLCETITNDILDCINNGNVNSISIICNTEGFEHGIAGLKNISKPIRRCLHLNLAEGRPVAPFSEVSFLVNKNGEFRFSFLRLWFAYVISSERKRNILLEQLKTEIEYQIEKYIISVGKTHSLNIDSHRHFHLIPFLSDILIGLTKKYKIAFIRTPYEFRYFSIKTIKNYFSINLIKNILLNHLSKKLKARLEKSNICTNECFVGVLSTGNMTYASLTTALGKINNKAVPKSVDILFHPGGVNSKNDVRWTINPRFRSYYSSANRMNELRLLKQNRLKNVNSSYIKVV